MTNNKSIELQSNPRIPSSTKYHPGLRYFSNTFHKNLLGGVEKMQDEILVGKGFD